LKAKGNNMFEDYDSSLDDANDENYVPHYEETDWEWEGGSMESEDESGEVVE